MDFGLPQFSLNLHEGTAAHYSLGHIEIYPKFWVPMFHKKIYIYKVWFWFLK